MITYRHFRNGDPPSLVKIWNESQLGRGAAGTVSPDAFDEFVFSPLYFDRSGLILALDDGRPIGFGHAGFSYNENLEKLDRTAGVICAVVVLPEYRQKGIGRELVKRLEQYLREQGSTKLLAGQRPGCDPFYHGLYGGAEPLGFLKSDSAAAHFFDRLGYKPELEFSVWQRDLLKISDPAPDMKAIQARRELVIEFSQSFPDDNWWWETRRGRLQPLRVLLRRKKDSKIVGSAAFFGLDLYLDRWNLRVAGLSDIHIQPEARRKGYARLLLLEISRRLREHDVSHLEIYLAQENLAGGNLARRLGFVQVDSSVSYTRQAE